MSEQPDPSTPPAPAPRVPTRDKKPMGLQPKTEAAVREVLERTARDHSPSYKAVALRHGISWKSLKTAVSRVRSGDIQLGLPNDVEQMEIDAGVEMARTLRLLAELEHFCNDALEGLLKTARGFTSRGKVLAYRDLGIPQVVGDIKQIANLRRTKEEGYMAILEKVNRERHVKMPVADIQTEVTRADPSAAAVRALEALKRAAPVPAAADATPPAEP